MIVALVVFSIAALGSAAALTVSARMQLNAAARREALSALQSQAGALALLSCATLAAGQRVVGAVTVQWSVEPSDTLARVTLVAVHRGTHTSLQTEIACE